MSRHDGRRAAGAPAGSPCAPCPAGCREGTKDPFPHSAVAPRSPRAVCGVLASGISSAVLPPPHRHGARGLSLPTPVPEGGVRRLPLVLRISCSRLVSGVALAAPWGIPRGSQSPQLRARWQQALDRWLPGGVAGRGRPPRPAMFQSRGARTPPRVSLSRPRVPPRVSTN